MILLYIWYGSLTFWNEIKSFDWFILNPWDGSVWCTFVTWSKNGRRKPFNYLDLKTTWLGHIGSRDFSLVTSERFFFHKWRMFGKFDHEKKNRDLKNLEFKKKLTIQTSRCKICNFFEMHCWGSNGDIIWSHFSSLNLENNQALLFGYYLLSPSSSLKKYKCSIKFTNLLENSFISGLIQESN